jgi:hypothetical protein
VKPYLSGSNPPTRRLSLVGAAGGLLVAVFLVIAVAGTWNIYSIRIATKWLMWSRRYKNEVLAQSGRKAGELRHIKWDGWGWAGQDTTVYLVFDPTDSLSTAATSHAAGKFAGIPCEAAQVHQLESHWYSVQFYTNEFWGRRNALDCTGFQ